MNFDERKAGYNYVCLIGKASDTFVILTEQDRQKSNANVRAVAGFLRSSRENLGKYVGREIRVSEIDCLEEFIEGSFFAVGDFAKIVNDFYQGRIKR